MKRESLNDFMFRGMCFMLNVRNRLHPPVKALIEAGVKPGMRMLDYGCGPGGHSLAAAEMVGKEGKVYAADIHPLAAGMVKKTATRKGLSNIETITTDCKTGLQPASIDLVLFYDTLHAIGNPRPVIEEFHRVLKPGGVLSVSAEHMNKRDILARITGTGLFKLVKKNGRTYTFIKEG